MIINIFLPKTLKINIRLKNKGKILLDTIDGKKLFSLKL
jgi:hypothetical protein